MPGMSRGRTHFARRFLFLRLLRLSLGAGAAANVLVAGTLVGLAPRSLDLLPATWLDRGDGGRWVLAVLCLMLAALYAVAARDPRRYSAIIAVAIAGRLGLGLVLIALAAGRPEHSPLPVWAALEITLGAAHGLFWYPVYR